MKSTVQNTSKALAGIAITALALLGCSSAGTADSTEASNSDIPTMKEGVLTLCVNSGTPPNIFLEGESERVGTEVDIAEAMADVIGIDTSYEEYDFSGLVAALQAGQCDVIMSSLYINPEREEIVDFVPYLLSSTGVAVSEDNPAKITGFDDSLCGNRVLTITGATGSTLTEEKSAECEEEGLGAIEITYGDKLTAALQQLTANQVDAFIDTAELVSYYQKKSEGTFDLVGEPVGSIQIGAATVKDNPELHETLQEAFQEIVDNGTYDSILADWGVESQSIENK